MAWLQLKKGKYIIHVLHKVIYDTNDSYIVLRKFISIHALSKLVSIFDLDLWPQGYICNLRHFLTSTQHKQPLCQIGAPSIKKIEREICPLSYFALRPVWQTSRTYSEIETFEPWHVISNNVAFVDSDEPVAHPFKLRHSKWCSVSSLTLIEYSSD